MIEGESESEGEGEGGETGGGGAAEGRGGAFARLKRQVVAQDLLRKRPRYYIGAAGAAGGLFLLGLAVIAGARRLGVRLLGAALLGEASVQLAFIAHDVGHRAVTERRRVNDAAGLVLGNLLLGISRTWWIDKHNAHHSHPNEVDADPDIDIPFVAFSEGQALEKRGLSRLLVRYQAWLLFPVMALVGAWSWHAYSVQTVLGRGLRYGTAERVLLAAHAAWVAAFLGLLVGGWPAVACLLVHHSVLGLHLGSVFAPNHKGMLVLEPGSRLDFLRRQVLTSRNVRPGWLTDTLYGGLNYQIEHHLFPSLPRPALGRARTTVRRFCDAEGVSYHETGVVQSFREVVRYMHAVGAPLRRRPG